MKIVNKEEFINTIKEGITVVDFYADWCGPCKMLGPILEELQEEMPNVKFIKVNVDDNEDLAIQYGIMSIPAVFLFKDNELKDKSIGLVQKQTMKNFIEKNY